MVYFQKARLAYLVNARAGSHINIAHRTIIYYVLDERVVLVWRIFSDPRKSLLFLSRELSLAQDHKNSGVSAPKPSIPPFPKEESFSGQVNFMRTLNNEQLEKRIEEIELGTTFKEPTAKKNSEELNELESEALRVLLSEVAAIHAV